MPSCGRLGNLCSCAWCPLQSRSTLPPPLPATTSSVYLEQVERDLMSALDRLLREETWQPLSADLPVLKSSNELVRAGPATGT